MSEWFVQTIFEAESSVARSAGDIYLSHTLQVSRCRDNKIWLRPNLFIARNFHQFKHPKTEDCTPVSRMADEPTSSPFHTVALTTVNRRDSNAAQKPPAPSLLRPPVQSPPETLSTNIADFISSRPSPWPSNNNRYYSARSD